MAFLPRTCPWSSLAKATSISTRICSRPIPLARSIATKSTAAPMGVRSCQSSYRQAWARQPSLFSSSKMGNRSISSTAAPKSAATLSAASPPLLDASSDSQSSSHSIPVLTTPAVATWLYICSGMVIGIIVLGGVTRLTESGLSITEWEPVKGILPPIGEKQWMVEWEKYKVTPEGILMNSQLDMPSFKRIFYMEWAHRVAGRALGVAFILPAAYFLARNRVSPSTRWKLLALAGGIGFQGLLGWYMVKSGLSQEILDTPGAVPRVSQYRLAAHLGAALTLYTGMVWTAIGISRDWRYAMQEGKVGGVEVGRLQEVLARPEVRKFGKWVGVVGGLVLLTAVSGAFVAGLDAGLVYNEFPTMGGRLVPPTEELFDTHYAKAADGSDNWWRNILENPTTVQFDHRVLATTTFLSILSLPLLATRPSLRALLPPLTPRFAKGAMHAVFLQVTLGITTLLYLVPVPLAAAHQAGSVLLLTMMLGLAGSLRRPGRVARLVREARGRAAGSGKVAGAV